MVSFGSEIPSWFAGESPPCVVLCGGRGSRLLPLSLTRQKSMIEVAGYPILWHIVRYWSAFTDRFIFVVKHRKEDILGYVPGLGIQCEFAEPKTLAGIADAIQTVEDLVGDRFMVVLGDCLCAGHFAFPRHFEQGVGVCMATPKDVLGSYSVETVTGSMEGSIQRVVEKPKTAPNPLCGMGYYFFYRKVFRYIAESRPSSLRNEKEITDVIQAMIDAGELVKAIPFQGTYVNITHPLDLQKARAFLAPEEPS